MRTLSTLFVVLALVLALAGQAPGAQDLTGDWTFSFTTADGSSYSDPATIQQNGNRFTGTVTYSSEGQAVEEPFEGVINADDSVVFTLYDQGQPVYHQGQVSPDGNTISGTWSVGDGSGTFTITRGQDQPKPSGQIPDISGDWTFSFTTEDGTSYSDPASIQQNNGRISGVVTYASEGREMTEPFEGTIDAAGNVEFSLNDQGQIVDHRGRLNPNGTITGTWSMSDNGQGTFTLTPGQAGPATGYDLTGDWTFAFVTDDGTSYTDPASIQQNGNTFSGAVTYYDNGQEIQEPFDGVINPDGTVSFTLYDQGEPVDHEGRVSPDGNTISGTWSFPDGKGTFTITRGAPVNTGGGASGYDLAGNWTFAFTTEDGTSYSDPASIQQTGDQFTGKVTYADQGQQLEEPFEGVVRADGSVEFVLYDQGEPVQHWGRVSQDGNAIQGDWSFSNGSGTFTLTRN